MLLSWCVDSSLLKAHCGRGRSPIPFVAASREGRSVWPCAAEGLREGAGEAALGHEGAASAVALAHCSRARARKKCGRLKRGVWGALVACSFPSGPEAWMEARARRWRTRPDAVWRHFVVTGPFLAVLMPTSGAQEGLILA